MDYETLAGAASLENVTQALQKRNIEVVVVDTRAEALTKIQELIPEGASINNGSSTTLGEIGLIEYLKANPGKWNNLHAAAIAEKDPEKQSAFRKEALFADYYLGSVHAVAETGEVIIASASASQLPPIVSTSPNLIFVVGTQKITPTLDEAIKRLRTHVFPLENQRMKDAGMGGTVLAKIVILEHEPEFTRRKIRLIFVKEKLGF